MSISQQDLDVRLQLTGCKYGELANRYANDLKYGKKCATTNGRDLALLNAYIEIMECYNTDEARIRPYYEYNFSRKGAFPAGVTVIILAGGVPIMDPIVTIGDAYTDTVLIVDAINAYNDENFTAYFEYIHPNTYKFSLYGPCSNPNLQASANGVVTDVEWASLGACVGLDNNCFTEDQLKTILDSISKLTKICFQPFDFTYTEE
jgi:hypothetical protein